VTVKLPSRPFSAAISADGNWLFATLIGTEGNPPGLAVVRREPAAMTLTRVVPLEGAPAGLALTPDGKQLLVAARDQVRLLNVAALISGDGDPIAATLHDGAGSGSIYVDVTRDGRHAFVSEERVAAITVIDLARRAEIGKIPVGRAPIALTFSPDGKLLYTTSQAALKEWGWPDVCKPEGGVPPGVLPLHPEGAVVLIDVAKAIVDPPQSVVSRVPAACNPVRLAIQPRGKRVFVIARNSDAVFGFDTRKLVRDPARARIGMVKVGRRPCR